MPGRDREPTLHGPQGILDALRTGSSSLVERYREDPIGLAEHFNLKLPKKPVQVMVELGVLTVEQAEEKFGKLQPGIRELVYETCMREVLSAAAVANRGGGKSLGVSFIEFFLVFLALFDALNLGGSELQAANVYDYLISYIESEKEFQDLVKGDPMRERTYTKAGAWIRVLTASQKSVRSPHAGGRKKDGRLAGGLLVIDEEAEAAPDIVEAALPTVNTARPSVVVRCSTFHNNEGTFADLIDSHEEMGFKLYRWDIFDVMERCDCTGGVCQSQEKCFREDHVEKFIDPEDGQEKEKLVHKAYCGGRAQYADGWIPLTEAETMWRRMRRNHQRWEVEAMGSRPSTSGHVIKDQMLLSANIVDDAAETLYEPGFPVSIDVDWGTHAAGLCAWQEQRDPRGAERHILLYASQIEENNQTQMNGLILGLANLYGLDVEEVAADIGGGGNYMNPALREDHHLPVRDVVFNQEKEAAVAAFNFYSESGRVVIPREFTEFIHQARNWKRDDHGQIKKKNDHVMDSGVVCYFSKFIDRLGLENVRIVPRSMNTQVASPMELRDLQRRGEADPHPYPVVYRPLVRTIGSGSRRR